MSVITHEFFILSEFLNLFSSTHIVFWWAEGVRVHHGNIGLEVRWYETTTKSQQPWIFVKCWKRSLVAVIASMAKGLVSTISKIDGSRASSKSVKKCKTPSWAPTTNKVLLAFFKNVSLILLRKPSDLFYCDGNMSENSLY